MAKEILNEDHAHAIGFARYAYDYIEAARVVDRVIGSRPGYEYISPVPAYHLAAHGIELTLKAFLRFKGIPDGDLRERRYGHDLGACMRKAKELGLKDIFKEHPNDEKAMRLLIGLDKHQGLRYVRAGEKEFPSWAIVFPLAVRLHQAISPLVGYEKTFTAGFGGY